VASPSNQTRKKNGYHQLVEEESEIDFEKDKEESLLDKKSEKDTQPEFKKIK
jgi:hypothetical protein